MVDAVWPDSEGRPKFTTDRRTSGSLSSDAARFEAGGVEQPGEVAEHRLAELATGHHPLIAGFFIAVGIVVGQPVEQRWLQPILRREGVRHRPAPRRPTHAARESPAS
jgi:hypothetical protein